MVLRPVADTEEGRQVFRLARSFAPLLKFDAPSKFLGGLLDPGERDFPLGLDFDLDWDLSNNFENYRDFRCRYYQTSPRDLLLYKGLGYYRNLAVTLDGRRYLVHQYWYYFPWNTGLVFGVEPEGFTLVELYQRVDPSAAEEERIRTRWRAGLELWRDRLRKAVQAAASRKERLELERCLGWVERNLSDPDASPTARWYVEKVVTTSVMYMGRGGLPKVHVYAAAEVEWSADHPVVYVARGYHEFVARRKDFSFWCDCDPPWIQEPDLTLCNLMDPYDRRNPFPAAMDPRGLRPRLHGAFVEHPFFRSGVLPFLRRRKGAAGGRSGEGNVSGGGTGATSE